MEYLKQFQIHLNNNDLPSTVTLWQEYCLSDEIDPEELKLILNEFKKSSLKDSLGLYVPDIFGLWETLPSSDIKHEIFKLIYDLQITHDKALADKAYQYLDHLYGKDPDFAQKIRLVGLREKKHFPFCISNFELLNHMKKGNFFLHTGGWGVGEVTDVSMLREQITLEFDFVAGHKELSFANAFKVLIPLNSDHFLARRFGDPENFEVFAKANPAETIRMLLQDLGPKTASEIKDELLDLVIPEKDWTKWWQNARAKIKKDTLIESPDNPKDPFFLRSKEISHEERLQKALSAKPDPKTLIEMLYSFLRDFPTAQKNPSFKKLIIDELIEILSHKELQSAEEIQILFILQDLDHEKANALSELIPQYENLEKIVSDIHVLAYKKRLLVEIVKSCPTWDQIFAHLLITIDQNTLRDFLIEELLKHSKKDLVKKTLHELIESPNLSPSGFLWYFQKIMAHESYPFADQEGRNRFFESFFVLLHKLESQGDKEFIKKMHNFLSSGRFAHVRRIFQGADIETVKEILLLSTKCYTLSNHDVKILHSLAEVVHPSLQKLGKGHQEEEHHVWTTEEGYRKIKNRIEQIATVETVENAKEIEIARSHGDLRENSEYKFALEKRSRLQSELRFLSEQIKEMRILTKLDINTNTVSVGTVVHLEDAQHKKITYTLLGPWDADPEKNVLSFQSKLAKELLGLTVGKKVTLNDNEWKVTLIESFL